MAPQSTTTNGPSRRALSWWIAVASTSLPVPRLALEEDGHILRRCELENTKDVPHRLAVRDRTSERRPPRERELDRDSVDANEELRASEGELGALGDHHLGDPCAVEERAVAAPAIDDPHAARFAMHLEVLARHERIRQAQVARLPGSDDRHTAVRTDAKPRLGPLHDGKLGAANDEEMQLVEARGSRRGLVAGVAHDSNHRRRARVGANGSVTG